ncbi:MAG: hypothetical protein IPM74_01530 [Crocinitomicaceae bacterium]|nr:hypothetical protein [Crocinitomicaceae bacterium]MBK8924598.1 hypothetical protein [Crocinitomicaceae bacterium]
MKRIKSIKLTSLYLFFVFAICQSTESLAHSYFVSTSQMEYNEQSKTIDVSLKLTAHDFEHILEEKFNQRMHIEDIADSSETGQYIQNYLKENFTLSSENILAEFMYVGKEVTLRDELFFYFSFSNITNAKIIHVKNTVLFLQFNQQQNMISYKYLDKTVSVTLVASKAESDLLIE